MAANKALKKYFDFFKSSLDKAIKSPTHEVYMEWDDNKGILLSQIDDVDDGSKVSVAGIIEVMDYMQQKIVNVPPWPSFKHEGTELKILEDVSRDMIDLSRYLSDDVPDIEKTMSELIHQYYLMCFKAGPSLPQCDYLYEIQQASDVCTYWQENMTREMLKEVMESLQQKEVCLRDKEESDDTLGDQLKSVVIRGVLDDVTEMYLEVPDDTAKFVIYVVEKAHNESEEISEFYESLFRCLERNLFDEGYLYSKTQDDTWEKHLEKAKQVLLQESFGNRYCEEVYEKFTLALVRHVRFGCKGEKQKTYLRLLSKFLMEVDAKGSEKAQSAISSANTYAERHFSDEITLASADGDAYGALILGTKMLKDDRSGYEDKYKNIFETEILPKLSADTTDRALEFILVSIEAGRKYCLKWSQKLIEKRKGFDFKERKDVVQKILDAIKRLDEINRADDAYYHQDLYEALVATLKSKKLLGEFEDDMIEIVKVGIPKRKSFLHRLLQTPCEEIRWDKKIEMTKEVIDLMYERIQQPIEKEESDVEWAIRGTLLFILRVVRDAAVKVELAPHLAKIFHYCKDQDFDKDSGGKTVHHEVLKTIMEDYLYSNKDNMEILKPMVEDVKELWECGDEELERDANNIMTALGPETAALLGDHADDVIDKYLEDNDTHVLFQFPSMYDQSPKLFHPKLDPILQKMKGADAHVQMSTMNFFWHISKNDPDVITQDHVDTVVPYCMDNMVKNNVGMFLQEIVQRDAKMIDKHGDTIMKAMKADPQFGPIAGNIIFVLAALDLEHAEKYTKFMVEYMEEVPVVNRIHILFGLKTVANKYRDVVEKYRSNIEKQKENDQLRDYVIAIIDVLEERTLENLDKAVKEQEEDIDNLDQRVTTTEENVDNLGKEVDEAKTDIKHVQEDVNKVEGRVDDLENVVEETVERVDELEHRTLSHAPEWSHEVCKLMNPEADHDWRLLAQRLGYTNDDIRNWATQPDPCMSLLDEWFATHKTREATHAVLKSLQEMNRTDAASIVEKALKAVEDIIQDQPEDYDNPPPVFISYQWGLQQEVRLLKKHLKDAGYEGWMDIGQMGGGDKLYEKIDQGIRAAKVVICCVSDKYAASPNCNREVALCVNLGKPIIPLLMEKMSWPPPGSMGPIFGEYLFIRFFTRPGEETGDQRYWSAAKFQELLMQLRYNIIPDKSLISGEYSNWWEPTEEEIVIKPKNNEAKSGNKASEDQKENDEASPSVFISYQWGKQKQIKALYRKLTSEGYHCWLDINQMGGGDSLYDKIDRGVRGCKVVVSCVTTKYSLSANCRREVSLADAIKKPIIPLLLEKMSWPPEGPMSMPFTQLLYINFCKPDADIQNHWEVPQFQELMEKIREYAPEAELDIGGDQSEVEHGDETTEQSGKTSEQSAGSHSSLEKKENEDKNIQSEESKDKEEKATENLAVTDGDEIAQKHTPNTEQSKSNTEDTPTPVTPPAPPAQKPKKPVQVTASQKKSSTCNIL